MKKKYKSIFVFIVTLFVLFAFAGCGDVPSKDYPDNTPDNSENYEDKEVVKITYSTVNYFGGYTREYLFDFTSGTASKRAYMPPFDIDDGIPEYQQFADFTESAATVFFDKCHTGGLFSLKKSYVTQDIIYDGGGWSLIFEFVDGTSFSSTGSNAGPYDVFEECKYAFYELCGEGVVGSIPSEFFIPPDISLSFRYRADNINYSDNSLARTSRGNYLWNGHSVSDTSYYQVNLELSEHNKFEDAYQYTLVLYTANYDYSKKFDKFTLTCYDYNEQMSGENEIFSSGWFSQEEFPLQFNKIYIYKLYWSNGDFAEYTFNTKLHN